MLPGAREPVTGKPNELSVTVPAKPFLLARLIFDVSDPPWAIVIWVFSAEIAKSGPITLADMSVK
jgi:hypothetical protein